MRYYIIILSIPIAAIVGGLVGPAAGTVGELVGLAAGWVGWQCA